MHGLCPNHTFGRQYTFMKIRRPLINAAVAVSALLMAGCATGRRDWAEVTLVSVKANPYGLVTARLSTRHSNRLGIQSGHYVDGIYHRDWMISGGGNLLWRFIPGYAAVGLDLNPERGPVTGGFTNSPLFGRLLLHVGETRRVYTGEPLALYDFTVDGKRYSYLYRVVPRDAL
jgi:hypothetical protein